MDKKLIVVYKSEELANDIITKRLIKNNKMTMEVASKQIGISKATLSRLEIGKTPDVITLGKICAWLGTEPDKYFSVNTLVIHETVKL